MAATAARPVEPTVVTVDLGPRSYDILIGRDVLEHAGAEIARRMPGRRVAVVTDENVARFHLNTLSASLRAAGIDFTTITVPPGEKSKSFADAGDGRRRHPRRPYRALRPGRRLRRRRGRRSRRLCRGHRAPRRPLRADPDHPARPGRFLGRRQDRHQHRRAARTWSAPSTSRASCWPTPACSIR